MYNNTEFKGTLIDFSHDERGEDTQRATIRDCSLGADPGVIPAVKVVTDGLGAKCLISFLQAICCLVDNCILGVAQSAIRFNEVTAHLKTYSNAHVISNCEFIYHRWSLVNADEELSVQGCTFEGHGVMEHAYYDDIPNTFGSDSVTFTFDPASQTINRDHGSWIEDGWKVGYHPYFFMETAGTDNARKLL